MERIEFKRYYPEEYYKWTGTKLPESQSAQELPMKINQNDDTISNVSAWKQGRGGKKQSAKASNFKHSQRIFNLNKASEVDRFNENLNEFKKTLKFNPKRLKQGLLQKEDLIKMQQAKTPSAKQSSLRMSVSDAKRKLGNRLQGDVSTIKTLEILKLINSVNELKEKNEILQQTKLSCLAQQFSDEDPAQKEEMAMEAINEML